MVVLYLDRTKAVLSKESEKGSPTRLVAVEELEEGQGSCKAPDGVGPRRMARICQLYYLAK